MAKQRNKRASKAHHESPRSERFKKIFGYSISGQQNWEERLLDAERAKELEDRYHLPSKQKRGIVE